MHMYVSVVAGIWAIICALIGTIVNVIALIVIYSRGSIRDQAFTPFVVSLTLSDLIFSLVFLPMNAVRYFTRTWIFPECTCEIFPVFFYANACISTFSLALIAISRVFTAFEMSNKYFTMRNNLLMAITAWFLAFAYTTIPWTTGHNINITVMPY
jgi:hypothetical protein